MKIRVQMFAFARQCAGTEVVEVELPEGGTVGELRRQLFAQAPGLDALGSRLLFAVDAEYSPDSTPLRPENEVACIPPVSGG